MENAGATTPGRSEWQDKVAIVTGAAGGIGRVIAQDLLAAGACVVWVGRHLDALRSALEPLGEAAAERSLVVVADISREPDVRKLVARTVRRWKRVDLLINNAALRGPTAPITQLSLQAWRQVMETNLTGPFLMARECLPYMQKQRRGSIVNISSTAAHFAYPLRAAYSASKSGLLNLTRTLAQEAGEFGVRVNAICPGPVDGAALDGVIAARAKSRGLSAAAMRRKFLAPTAMHLSVSPQDVSRAVLFLCSSASVHITGKVLDVSAGYGLWPAVE